MPPQLALRRSSQPTHGIRSLDPSNVNPDQDHFQQGLRPWVPDIWNNSIGAFLATAKVTSKGDLASYNYTMQTPEAPHWQTSMEEEMESLKENGTWELVNLTHGHTTLKNRWVFVTKQNTLGEVTHYRARLVTKGFTQTTGINYEETFTPVT